MKTMKIITMNSKQHFFIITELLVIITAVLLIGCKDNPLVSNRQYRNNFTGKIILHQTGGIAGVSRIIAIGEEEGFILLTLVDNRTDQRIEHSVSQKDLDLLWQTLETNDIFILPTNQEMLTNVRDGFSYEIGVQRGKKQHHFSVYAPEQLIRNGETRYNDIVQTITLFANSRLQWGIGGIEGTITDLEGKPVSGMRVGIVSGTTGFPEIAVETKEGGYYQIGSVPSGTFEVAVHDKQGNRIGFESVTVRSGETSTLNFIIPTQIAE
jgi:hypothetical protein